MITFNKSNILFTILFIISISFNIYFLTKNNNVDYSEYYKSIDSLNTKIQEKDIQLYLLKEQIDSISKYSRTDTNIIYEKYKEKYKNNLSCQFYNYSIPIKRIFFFITPLIAADFFSSYLF